MPTLWSDPCDARLVGESATTATKWREEMVEQDRELVKKFWGEEERSEDGDGCNFKRWPRDTTTDAQLWMS